MIKFVESEKTKNKNVVMWNGVRKNTSWAFYSYDETGKPKVVSKQKFFAWAVQWDAWEATAAKEKEKVTPEVKPWEI